MLSSRERCLIDSEGELLPVQKDIKWFDLLKFRQVWALTIA
jgi:hypothetical protein